MGGARGGSEGHGGVYLTQVFILVSAQETCRGDFADFSCSALRTAVLHSPQGQRTAHV